MELSKLNILGSVAIIIRPSTFRPINGKASNLLFSITLLMFRLSDSKATNKDTQGGGTLTVEYNTVNGTL